MAFKRVLIMIAAMALMLGVASCGGGDDGEGSAAAPAETTSPEAGGGKPSPSGSGAAPSESQFVKEANAVCKQAREELVTATTRYLGEQDSGAKSQEALVEVTQVVLIPSMEEQIEQLRALNPPSASAGQVEAFLASWQRTLDSVASGSTPLAGAYAKKILGPVGDQARKVGLDQCTYG